jgi:small nuclear ribonucleoprotein
MRIEGVVVDEIRHHKGRVVVVKLMDGRSIRGKLEDVDDRLNVTLSDAEQILAEDRSQSLGRLLIRGDSMSIISL